MLKTGDKFLVKDNLGKKYEYTFLGIDPTDETGCSYIKLYNNNDKTETSVEIAWFEQRKIKGILRENYRDFSKILPHMSVPKMGNGA